MNDTRVMELLKIAVEHIESFEDRESENVLKALGFTEDELAEIRFHLEFDDKDKENIYMVQGKVFHHGEVIWELTYFGNEYIFQISEKRVKLSMVIFPKMCHLKSIRIIFIMMKAEMYIVVMPITVLQKVM